jgi:tetratricopeptide (TPR) repeat protein
LTVRRGILLGAALAAVAVAAYVPAFTAGFVFDDHALVVGSAFVRGPFPALWLGSDAPDYLPLTWSTFWLEWRAWGDAAAAYHAANVALHAGAAVLLWRVLRALRVPGAWLGAAVFAVHPAAVESVAWISERKNTLSAVLFLASILAWVRAEDRAAAEGTERWTSARTASLLLFVAALLAKASVVMLPAVLLGIALWRGGRLRRAHAIAIAPFAAVAVGAGILAWSLQRLNAIGDAPFAARGAWERIGGAAWALLGYERTALIPVRLSFVYPDWPVPPSSPAFALPLLAIAAAAITAWRLRGRPWIRATAWAMGTHAVLVAPVLGLVDMSYLRVGPMSNHLQYLALMGPAALGGAALARLERWTGRAGAAALASVLVALLGVASFRRATTFSDDLTLWQTAVREAPGNAFAHKQLAATLASLGRGPEALAEIEAFARTTRDAAERHRARSVRFALLGRYDEAVAEGRQAERIRSDPDFRRDLGRRLVIAGRAGEAIEMLEPLVRGAPENVEYRYWLGIALTIAGRPGEAAAVLREASRLAPGDPRIADALASALRAEAGRSPRAAHEDGACLGGGVGGEGSAAVRQPDEIGLAARQRVAVAARRRVQDADRAVSGGEREGPIEGLALPSVIPGEMERRGEVQVGLRRAGLEPDGAVRRLGRGARIAAEQVHPRDGARDLRRPGVPRGGPLEERAPLLHPPRRRRRDAEVEVRLPLARVHRQRGGEEGLVAAPVREPGHDRRRADQRCTEDDGRRRGAHRCAEPPRPLTRRGDALRDEPGEPDRRHVEVAFRRHPEPGARERAGGEAREEHRHRHGEAADAQRQGDERDDRERRGGEAERAEGRVRPSDRERERRQSAQAVRPDRGEPGARNGHDRRGHVAQDGPHAEGGSPEVRDPDRGHDRDPPRQRLTRGPPLGPVVRQDHRPRRDEPLLREEAGEEDRAVQRRARPPRAGADEEQREQGERGEQVVTARDPGDGLRLERVQRPEERGRAGAGPARAGDAPQHQGREQRGRDRVEQDVPRVERARPRAERGVRRVREDCDRPPVPARRAPGRLPEVEIRAERLSQAREPGERRVRLDEDVVVPDEPQVHRAPEGDGRRERDRHGQRGAGPDGPCTHALCAGSRLAHFAWHLLQSDVWNDANDVGLRSYIAPRVSACVRPCATAGLAAAPEASVPGHCPAATMNSLLVFHRIAPSHPDACARWHERHITFSFPERGPVRALPSLRARAASSKRSVVPSSNGTSEV